MLLSYLEGHIPFSQAHNSAVLTGIPASLAALRQTCQGTIEIFPFAVLEERILYCQFSGI
jgi:hypothetical protein